MTNFDEIKSLTPFGLGMYLERKLHVDSCGGCIVPPKLCRKIAKKLNQRNDENGPSRIDCALRIEAFLMLESEATDG